MKKTGKREDQDKEDQMKSNKLIAYLSINSENCKSVNWERENAMLHQNGHIGVFKMSIVYSLNFIQISAKFMSNKPKLY